MLSYRQLTDLRFDHKTLLLSLLLADLGLVALYLGHRLGGWPSSHYYNIGIDGSIPEYFQYFKEIFLATILFLIYRRKRFLSALLWSMIAILFFVDDAFQVHEKLGTVVSSALNLTSAYGIRAQDFGEIVAAGLMAVPLFAGLAFCFLREEKESNWLSRNLFILLLFLGVFGVLIDLFVHKLQIIALYVTEEGGEMVIMSFMVWYAFRYLATGAIRFRLRPEI